MKFVEFRLLNWLLKYSGITRYNLSLSGMREPNLKKLGVNTKFEDFAQEPDVHESLLSGTIARIHGVEPENVVITSGGSEAIFLAYSVFGKNGNAVVPLPNYEPIFAIPESLGMKVVNSLRGRSIRRGSIIGLTNPNNPTGKWINDEAMKEIIRFAKKQHSYVFSNETYREFKFESPVQYSFEEADNFIVCNSLTKFYGLGRLRIGWLIAAKPNAKLLHAAKQLVSGHSSEYSMWVAKQVLEKRKHFVERTKKVYFENIKLVKQFIETSPHISAELPDAAPFCLVKYRKGPNSETMASDLLKSKSVLVSPGDYFGAPKSFRLCFTNDRSVLEPGLNELSNFLNRQLNI